MSKLFQVAFTAIFFAGFSSFLAAQTPQITETVPSESFLGEPFCFETNFTNSGPPGFGPYLRLVVPPELQFDSASIFGTNSGVETVGVFPAAPGNELIDPNIDEAVTGPEGSSLIILTYPVGSVVDGGPELPLEICLIISPDAEVGVPLPVDLTPIYEFGDTATGDNGPIIAPVVNQNVTPTLLRFEKDDTAPESERPPGPSWPYDYVLTVDIANTATINPLVITDTLPADFQFTGPVTVTGGAGCVETQTPSTITPGGTLEVTCTNDIVGTANAADVVVSYSGFIIDTLDENNCTSETQTNNASAQGTYLPDAAPAQALPPVFSSTDVEAKHVAVQKGVSPAQASPGTALVYTLNFQVTDFGDASALVVTDTIPDGIDFVSHGSLSVNGGAAIPITESLTVNGDFTKTLVYDIGAVTGTLAAGSNITLSYNALLREDYQDVVGPVLAADTLNNSVTAAYDLVQGASTCSDGSSASVQIAPIGVDKQIVNPQPFYVPGDEVIFRLTLIVPTGDTQDIVTQDFLPLPVIDVDDLNLVFDSDGVFSNDGDIVRGPADNAGLMPDSITVNSAQNSLIIEWPDLDFPSDQSRTIQVDLHTTVTDDPFADGLFLTNILIASSTNTDGISTSATGPVSFEVGAPDLQITKGASATDGNGVINPAPSELPVDGDVVDVEANDAITYVITVENIGAASAFGVVVTDPGSSLIDGCTLDSVTDGTGATLATTGNISSGLTLTDPLAANDQNPLGGGAPYSDDTALITLNCQLEGVVEPNTDIVNTASVVWSSQSGAIDFPPETDEATATSRNIGQQKFFVASSESGTSDTATPPRATIGEIVRYRLAVRVPEGLISGFSIRDNLPGGLEYINDGSTRAVFVSNGTGLSASGVPGIGTETSAAADPTSVPSDLAWTALPGSAISGGVGNGGDPSFSFGDLLNQDDDSDDEFLIVEFNAVVRNVGGVNIGGNRSNSFTTLSGTTALNGNSNAVQVRFAEPVLSVDKNVSPGTADAGDTVSFTLGVANGGGANNSPAYDVVISDPLPTGLVSYSVTTITPSGCGSPAISDISTATDIEVAVDVMLPGCSITIEYEAELDGSVAPGADIVNTANAIWTGLPGTNGTSSNPTGSSNTGTPGSVTGERNGSGGSVNDYSRDDTATVNVPGVGLQKTVFDTSETETDDTQFRAGIDDLVIGEQATFRIVATVPEGTTPELEISDTLPFTSGIMRLDSATVLPLPLASNLTLEFPSPSPSISDAQNSDGIDDTVSFNFGQVTNTADGADDENDQITIEVVATLVDVMPNGNGDALTNSALVQFGPNLSDSATAELDVVEPILTITKDGSISEGDAGDQVSYTITIEHATGSTADAQDLVFQDMLPAGLQLVGPIISTPPADVDNSSGNNIDLGWIDLPLGDSITITYVAELQPSVSPGTTVQNIGALEWTSIAGIPDAGNGEVERTSTDSDTHEILITNPGLVKEVIDTSEASTDSAEFGAPDDLTIGEQVTYQFAVVFPEGTSNNAVVTDQLPTGSSVLEVVSFSVVSVGANLQDGASQPLVVPPGVASDNDADTVNDRITWTLGQVVNMPDGNTTEDDEILFEVVAVVLDNAANQSGVVDQLNTATLTTANIPDGISGTAAIDLVAPDIELRKTVTNPVDGFVDAGDTVDVQLEIEHSDDSTADGFNLLVTDTLPAGLEWIDDSTVTSDCAGFWIDSSAAPSITFGWPTLDRTTDICSVNYQVEVGAGVAAGETLQNTAVMNYDSTPNVVVGQTRTEMGSDVADVTVRAPGLLKEAVDSSLPDTGIDQGDPALMDLTIGETVTYEITLTFPEGVTNNAVLTDLMPIAPGVLEVIAANVETVGDNINFDPKPVTTLDEFQNADGFDDRAQIDFGTVTNLPADGGPDANDRVVVQIVARVVDVPANVDGIVLDNNATLNFDGDGGTGLSGSASVEVVEPQTELSKAMSLGANGLVTIALTVENIGTAPVYDLRLTDVLDEAIWDLSGGITPTNTPAGFELNLLPDTPAVGQQTLELVPAVGAVTPDGTIPVGASITAEFELPLAVLPPDPNPVENTAVQTGGDSLPGDDDNERDLPPDDDTAQLGVPALVLSKTAALQVDADTSSSVSPGDTLRYTLVLENTGQADATNIVINDTPDANTALVVGSVTTSSGTVNTGNTVGDTVIQVGIPALAATETVTITFDVVIDNPLPTGVNQIVNQADFDSTELPPGVSDDPAPPNPDDPTVVPLGDTAPDLTLVKDDGDASVAPGGTVSWTLSYENVGNQDATGVVITDTVPDNSSFNAGASTAGWICAPDNSAGSVCTFDVGDVDAGTADSVTFAVTVDSPLDAGVDELINAASIADDGNNGPDPTPDNNQDDDTTPITAAPDLTIVKDDADITAVPGSVVVYTLSYENVGTQNATGVEITDVVPVNTTFVPGSSTAGWTCTPDNTAGSSCVFSLGAVNAGDSGSVQFAVQLDDPLPLDFDNLPNTASIADDGSNGPDPTPDDNTDAENTPVTIDPALAIVKALSDAPDPIVAGSVLEYTITATNIGNVTLNNVVVTDNLITPTGGSTPCSSVAPGASCTLIGTYLATSDDVENGEIINTATADSDQTDPVDTTVTTPVPQNPALDLVKEAVLDDTSGNSLGDVGETINYTLTATNIGDVTLSNVVVVDPLLGVLVCSPTIPATLAPTESVVCTGSYVIQTVDLTAGAITNVATATGDGPDGTTVDDGDSTVTLLNAPMAVPTLSIWSLLMLTLSLLLLGAAAQLRRS